MYQHVMGSNLFGRPHKAKGQAEMSDSLFIQCAANVPSNGTSTLLSAPRRSAFGAGWSAPIDALGAAPLQDFPGTYGKSVRGLVAFPTSLLLKERRLGRPLT